MPANALSRCKGYLVVALDGTCGVVETPLFPPEGSDPDFLVVRTGGKSRPRFPIAAAALVLAVDPERELVLLRATRAEVAALPEHLPLAI